MSLSSRVVLACVALASANSVGCARTFQSPGKAAAAAEPRAGDATPARGCARDFVARAPGAWRYFQETRSNGPGPFEVHGAVYDGTDGHRYSVTCIDFAPGLAQVLDRSVEGARERWKSLLDESRFAPGSPIQSGSLSGFESTLRMGEEAGVVREFWVGDTLYLLFVLTREAPLLGTAWAFLDSFEVKPSWKTVSLGAPGFQLEVPRRARANQSVKDDTTLYRFIDDVVDDKIELCRVFDQATHTQVADLEGFHTSVRSRFEKQLTIRRDIRIEAGGTQAYEMDVDRPAPSPPERIRIFVQPDHLFILSVPLGADGTAKPDAQRCLDSFRFIAR